MNIIFDDDSLPQFEVIESLNESGNTIKKYHIKGIYSTIGEKNRNGRVYPYPLWEEQVNHYQNYIKNGSINTLMEYEHPARTNVDQMQAVAKILELKISDDKKYVYGDAVLLDNEKANQLKSLIDNGIKISVSSRGVGSVKDGKVQSFKLITYDIVPNPSDFNATMNGVCESHLLTEGIIEGLDFEVDGETIKEVHHEIQQEQNESDETYSADEMKEALKTRFDDFIKNL